MTGTNLNKPEATALLDQYSIGGADIVEVNSALHFYVNDKQGISEWRCAAVFDEHETVTHWQINDLFMAAESPRYPTFESLLDALG